jgi:hypothetical protein
MGRGWVKLGYPRKVVLAMHACPLCISPPGRTEFTMGHYGFYSPSNEPH